MGFQRKHVSHLVVVYKADTMGMKITTSRMTSPPGGQVRGLAHSEECVSITHGILSSHSNSAGRGLPLSPLHRGTVACQGHRRYAVALAPCSMVGSGASVSGEFLSKPGLSLPI